MRTKPFVSKIVWAASVLLGIGSAAATDLKTELAAMTPATASHKVGAPVSVYYQHLEAKKPGVDPSLTIAVVPGVAAQSLYVELVADSNVVVDHGGAPMALRGAKAATIYRRYLSVRRSGGSAAHKSGAGADVTANVRVIASVEIDGARFASIYVVPIDSAAAVVNRRAKTKQFRKRPQQ